MVLSHNLGAAGVYGLADALAATLKTHPEHLHGDAPTWRPRFDSPFFTVGTSRSRSVHPVSFESSDESDPSTDAAKMWQTTLADDKAGLHGAAGEADQRNMVGETPEGDSCRCLPGQLRPPKESTLLSHAAQMLNTSRLAASLDFHEANFNIGFKLNPTITKLEKQMTEYDTAAEKLKAASVKAEERGATLDEAWREVHDAYVNGCRQVEQDALKEGDNVPPTCADQHNKAKDDFSKRRLETQPKCEIGCAKFENMNLRATTASLLPADIGVEVFNAAAAAFAAAVVAGRGAVVAASVAEAAISTSSRPRRGCSISCARGFL